MPISHLLTASFFQPKEENILVSAPEVHFAHQNGVHDDPGQGQVVLIDTDAGTEDAWAIFMALAAQRARTVPSFKVVGITCVYGNTSVDNVCLNVSRTLRTLNENTVPIFRGMDSSMTSRFEHMDNPPYNGYDGFGDAKLTPLKAKVESDHAVNAIIKFAESNKGNLTILCLGPLTNLAMAVKLNPEIRNYIKELYILGGNIEGIGNATVCSEFNFYVDPEAAKVVLDNFTYCPIYILPYEVCHRYATSSYSWRLNSLGTMRTKEIDLLNKVEAKILDKYREGWLASDAVAAACLIDSEVIKKTENYHCTVELQGNHTRGLMVVDRNFLMQKPANVVVIEEVDRELYEKMLIWAAGGPSHKHN